MFRNKTSSLALSIIYIYNENENFAPAAFILSSAEMILTGLHSYLDYFSVNVLVYCISFYVSYV